MSQLLTPSLTCAERVKIHRTRELPVLGTITKGVGDTVKATDVVARAELLGDLEIVRVANLLGLEPNEAATRLKVQVGAHVKSGELLAQDSALWGLLKSIVTSPVDGTLEFFTESTGNIGIRLAPRAVELKSYISGRVVGVVPSKSVTIETIGVFVQGIFGVGGERLGTLQKLKISRETPVAVSHIPEKCSGAVLVGGTHPSLDALKCAADRGAVGFVSGSIDDTALKGFVGYDVGVAVTGDEDISMSVIVTEGFGEIPMSERVLSLLSSKEGAQVSLNGTTQVRAGAVRPEIIISEAGEATGAEQIIPRGLEVGCRVRLIRYPYFGKLGEVVELPHEPRRVDSGAYTRLLLARLDGTKEVVAVPRANVELL